MQNKRSTFWGDGKMKTDEILKSFDLLMKRKNQRKLSGTYEAKAIREEAKRLKEHLQFIQSYERHRKND